MFQDYFPDLRNMKKQERLPIQKQKIKELKTLLRTMLETDFKNKPIDFQVNGNILEVKLGGVGINEVLEKITQQKAAIIGRTDEIFSRAKYLYSTLDKTGDPNIYRWNHFYVPVKVGDDIFGVRIAIRDMKINQSQIYHYGIKKGTTSPTGRVGQSPGLSDGPQVVPLFQTVAQPDDPVKSLDSTKPRQLVRDSRRSYLSEIMSMINRDDYLSYNSVWRPVFQF